MQFDPKRANQTGHLLYQEGKLTYDSTNDLAIAAADLFANKYREHLEFWRATAMDDWEESQYLQARENKEVPLFFDSLQEYFAKRLTWG